MCLILEEKIEENRNLKCDAEKFQNFRSDVNKIKNEMQKQRNYSDDNFIDKKIFN